MYCTNTHVYEYLILLALLMAYRRTLQLIAIYTLDVHGHIPSGRIIRRRPNVSETVSVCLRVKEKSKYRLSLATWLGI